MYEPAPLLNATPSSTTVAPPGTQISIALHAVFDTGFVIDTFTLTPERYQQYGARVCDLLTKSMPGITWSQEHAAQSDDYDSLPESYPVLDISFVMASGPALLPTTELKFDGTNGVTRALTLSRAHIYYHAFKSGIFSVMATAAPGADWTQADWQAAEERLMTGLSEIVEARLSAMNTALYQAVTQARVPLYQSQFIGTEGTAFRSAKRATFEWSHRIFVMESDPADVTASAAFLLPRMRPIDRDGVQNMALASDWFIYLGSGRSLICSPRESQNEWSRAKSVAAIIRMVEVRQYVWRALYDVDRSLRNTIALIRSTSAPRAARKLVGELRELEFRVTGMLEELDPYKLTFDTESVWLMRQLDHNWLTADLVGSLRGRLEALNRVYEYHEETITRIREERLRAVLNLIGFVATAGSVAQIIGYFDPQNNQLNDSLRAVLLIAGVTTIILIFVLVLVVNLRARRE